jgi:hypothetical protein
MLHKNFPLSNKVLGEILKDIQILYPEANSIFLVGTYARVDEVPTKKEHDVDILIHFPARTNKQHIQQRPDDILWSTWSGHNRPIIDFLLMFGNKDTGYGQHIFRKEKGLKTPKILLWKK